MREQRAPLGVVCAMPEEVEHLRAVLVSDAQVERAGLTFLEGAIDGYSVVLVESGVGKVNAALVAALLLDGFGCRRLLVSGVAGGLDPRLGIGDIVIAERLIQHDYGARVGEGIKPFRPGMLPLGEPKDPLSYDLDDASRAAIAEVLIGFDPPVMPSAVTGGVPRQPAIHFGTIVTGDQFINSEDARATLHRQFGALAVEMEGAAAAQVAERYGTSCVVTRCLSDLAGHESQMDILAFLSVTAEIAARVVRRLLPAL